MEATFFKLVFFCLIGFALLVILGTAITAIVLGLKMAWHWLKPHVRSAKGKHSEASVGRTGRLHGQ